MERLAIEDLRRLIVHFESEIARATAEIDDRRNLRSSADALSKK